MALYGVHQKDLIAYDGTKIRYQDLGEGPPIILANGLGGTFDAWVYLVRHLSKKYRILSWDYRGLYRSGRPDLLRLTIPDHVDDLARAGAQVQLESVALEMRGRGDLERLDR